MFCFDFCLVLFWFLFVLSLYIEIFYYEIFLETEKMWEISRKIEFSEYNQTLENIFQNIFWNATKYLKIFSFFENIFTWKYFTLGKYFTFNQTQTLEFNECFFLIFVSFKFIYWNFLLWNLFGNWENGWENVKN